MFSLAYRALQVTRNVNILFTHFYHFFPWSRCIDSYRKNTSKINNIIFNTYVPLHKGPHQV